MIRWSIDTSSNLHIAITPFLNPSNFFNQISMLVGCQIQSIPSFSPTLGQCFIFAINHVTSDPISEDESAKHHGRIRTFSHFPGNWAMHVFIPCKSL